MSLNRATRRVLFRAVLLLAGALPAFAEAPRGISTGPGHFVLANEGEPIDVYTYKPPTYEKGPILVVIHGSDRDAEDYRNDAISIAERLEVIVVAPLFDRERFSDERYKRGCGVTNDGKLQPKDKWTFNVIVRLVAKVREMEGSRLAYYMIGHSGGGQFVAKMAMFMPDEAKGFVAANPGSNIFPSKELRFPYGLGGLPDELCSDEILRRYCAQPLTLYLGTGDVHQLESDSFDFSPGAMAQGPSRLERNHNFFNAMRKIAAQHGWPFNWQIVETREGIAHDGAKMFHAPEVEKALFGNNGGRCRKS